MSDDPFLSRWSRLKLAAKAGPDRPTAAAIPAKAGSQSSLSQTAEPQSAEEPPPLPPLESLTPQSDFVPFMRPDVDAGTRRQALKTLFQDPQWNVMDGLDVYIDDYSKSDPLPEGWLEKMNQFARLGDHLLTEEKREEAAGKAPVAVPEAAALPAKETAPAPQVFDTGDGVTPPAPVKESGT